MRTSAFVDGGSSHIRVLYQFLDAFEAVPFPHGHLTINQNVIGVVDNPVHSAANGRNQKRETHTLLMCYNAHRKSEANPKGAFQSKGVCLHVRYYGAVCR